jgi:hypothetical protein
MHCRVEQPVQRAERPRTGRRKPAPVCPVSVSCLVWLTPFTSGYVALAVASESGTVSREVDTGLGGDRQANMIAFATEALKMVESTIKGETKM